MGRPRKYSSPAQRQQAYRARQQADHQAPPPRRLPKPRSRAVRLLAGEDELRDLAEGYLTWRDAMPENLSTSQLADDLEQLVEQLENLADEVGALDPPRGFGR